MFTDAAKRNRGLQTLVVGFIVKMSADFHDDLVHVGPLRGACETVTCHG